ncbi:MAG: 1-(5-phosphoribosyl)-5-[(5-phosphoribosylamino)methylideneamino] imidazole-4-carboxamide isomerase [Planctomycetota bacterium]|nr:1-(5-phosphoribosyl)-5-[(5-phosphoribosylamino)methylideneamino] imidazole-4-carboxamide isomerase [Planctomycetota bacterium]
MLIIPAVDIKGGKAVRLKQGKADRETVYDADPVHAARRWADAGAQRIHVVDLDGAFDGVPRNSALTLAILREFCSAPRAAGGAERIEIEIGGGLRDAASIVEFMNTGAARCVLGTRALEDRAFLTTLAERYPGRISVGLDAKGGKLVTKGWVSQSETPATVLVRELRGLPLGEVIYTDIERDGMLSGPNLKRLEDMRKASPFPLIASGGITTVEHIRACRRLGCFGAIIGKAFYDGALTIREALEAARESAH